MYSLDVVPRLLNSQPEAATTFGWQASAEIETSGWPVGVVRMAHYRWLVHSNGDFIRHVDEYKWILEPGFADRAGNTTQLPLMPTRLAIVGWIVHAVAIYGVVSIPSGARAAIALRRRLTNRCPACGYSLDGLAAPECPECGKKLSEGN